MKIQLRQLQKNDKKIFLLDVEQVGQFRQAIVRYSQVTIDTAMNDFNPGQFKVRIKKMAAHVNFYLYPNAFLSSELFGA